MQANINKWSYFSLGGGQYHYRMILQLGHLADAFIESDLQ